MYEAIFVPEGILPPPREIIFTPELQVYIKNFGEGMADFCFVAEFAEKIVGAAWSRIMHDYGHIDDKTPSLALSVLKSFRRQGIATYLIYVLMESPETGVIFIASFNLTFISMVFFLTLFYQKKAKKQKRN